MEENEIEESSVQETEVKQGSGSLLAAARKQQNRSVEDIAKELNLGVAQIRSIELDQTEGLPEPTYVRGYIRAYAKLLGLDSEQVLEHYLNPNWQQGSSLEEMPRGIGGAEDPGRSSSLAKPIFFLMILALAAYLWSSGAFDSLFTASSPTQESEQQVYSEQNPFPIQSEASLDSVSEEGQQESELAEQQTQELENQTSSEQAGEDAQELSIEAEPQVQQIPSLKLTMQFSETSWIDVRNSDDERLAYRSFVEGEELEIDSEKTLHVFIGNADAVSVQVDGTNFDLSPYLEGVFARFNLEID